MNEDYDVQFNALRNALYHTGRRLFFERWNKVFNFMIIVLGATAMSSVFSEYQIDNVYLGAAVAVIGALQLVFDFAGRASEHRVLQRAYFEIVAEIEEAAPLSEEQKRMFSAKLMRAAAEEPPILRARDSKAYNDALAALGTYPDGERIKLRFHHALFGWLFSYDGYDFRKISEIEAQRTR